MFDVYTYGNSMKSGNPVMDSIGLTLSYSFLGDLTN